MIKDLKIENPVTFQIGNAPCTCTLKGKEGTYQVGSGVTFQDQHYGFVLTNQKGSKTYQTSAPLKGAISTRLFLHIFEEGKEGSWKINALNGEILENLEEKTSSLR